MKLPKPPFRIVCQTFGVMSEQIQSLDRAREELCAVHVFESYGARIYDDNGTDVTHVSNYAEASA